MMDDKTCNMCKETTSGTKWGRYDLAVSPNSDNTSAGPLTVAICPACGSFLFVKGE